jgi:transcriptional regulator with XRE-family HTH domain
MSRESYLAAQRQKNLFYDRNRAIARAQLELASALSQQRDRLGYSLEQIEQRTGISVDRLQMIEEGDTTSLPEVLALADEMDLALMFDGVTNIDVRPRSEMRIPLDKTRVSHRSEKLSIA